MENEWESTSMIESSSGAEYGAPTSTAMTGHTPAAFKSPPGWLWVTPPSTRRQEPIFLGANTPGTLELAIMASHR